VFKVSEDIRVIQVNRQTSDELKLKFTFMKPDRDIYPKIEKV
jgi:hypothetical protein